jgi:TrpR-related protein YerC/YecD
MNQKLNSEEVNRLFEAIAALKDVDECKDFFGDLCTINEILSMSQRLQVARLLKEHETYVDIAGETGASTATISRVNRALNYGTGGYDKILSRL